MEKIKSILISIKNFIISPKYLAKFYDLRKIFVFIIIVIDMALMLFPIKWVLDNNVQDFGENNQYIKELYNANDDNFIVDIKNTQFKIQDKTAYTIEDCIYSYKIENNDLVYYYVFDAYNVASNKLNELFDKGKEMNDSLSDDIIRYVSILTYIDSNNGYDIDEALNIYLTKDEDYLINKVESMNYLDIYNVSYDKEKSNYLIAFNKECMYVQLPNYNATTFYYTNDLDISNYDNTKLFLADINNQIAESLVNDEYNNYALITAFSLIIIPLSMGLIIYLLSKSRYQFALGGTYKIATICTIIPAVISAICSIFLRTAVFYLFLFIYIVYALVMGILSRKHITK